MIVYISTVSAFSETKWSGVCSKTRLIFYGVVLRTVEVFVERRFVVAPNMTIDCDCNYNQKEKEDALMAEFAAWKCD